jgi:hypothetical protein
MGSRRGRGRDCTLPIHRHRRFCSAGRIGGPSGRLSPPAHRPHRDRRRPRPAALGASRSKSSRATSRRGARRRPSRCRGPGVNGARCASSPPRRLRPAQSATPAGAEHRRTIRAPAACQLPDHPRMRPHFGPLQGGREAAVTLTQVPHAGRSVDQDHAAPSRLRRTGARSRWEPPSRARRRAHSPSIRASPRSGP